VFGFQLGDKTAQIFRHSFVVFDLCGSFFRNQFDVR